MAIRKKMIRKPYRTKKRKEKELRNEVRTVVAVMLLGMTCSSLVAFAETSNSFNIYGDSAEKTNAVVIPAAQLEAGALVAAKEEGSEITVTSQALAEVDYSNIPYIEKNKPPVKEQIRTIAEEECAALNLGSRCVIDTLAIAWKETKFKPLANGDHGNSWGCFQIYRIAHPEITIAQAQDIGFSTRWTINNLAAHGYTRNRDRAIRMHNGDPTIPQTKVYLDKVNEYIKGLSN